MPTLSLLLTLLFLYLYIRWFVNFVSGYRIVPSPWPAGRKFGRYTWRQVFKNQYDRRGFLHAFGHALTILVLLITMTTPDNAANATWAKIAILWVIVVAYWFFLSRWQQFQGGHRRLPKHRTYRRRY